MVPPASHKLTGVRGTQDPSQVRSLSPTGLSPPPVARSNAFGSALRPLLLVLQPLPSHSRKTTRFGLVPFRSPLLRESRLISLRRATEMFQFAHCPSSCLFHSAGDIQTSLWMGCPIRILKDRRSHAAPPERFAGLRVLLRPSAPRHPPRTLSRLCSPGISSLLSLRVHTPYLTYPHVTSCNTLPLPLFQKHTLAFLCFSLSSCLGNIEGFNNRYGKLKWCDARFTHCLLKLCYVVLHEDSAVHQSTTIVNLQLNHGRNQCGLHSATRASCALLVRY